MVVRCNGCKKVVIAPDPYRADPLLSSVYSIFDKKCDCGSVYLDEETNNIKADNEAELWHPPAEGWVRYVPYTT